jgi:hypothetical protein
MSESVGFAKRAGIWGAVAAVFGLITLIFAFTALMLALDEVMPLWAAALITFGVAALLTLITGAIAYSGARQVSVVPKKAISSAREDAQWARSQLRSSMSSNGNGMRSEPAPSASTGGYATTSRQ